MGTHNTKNNENWSTAKKDVELQLKELSHNYDLSLELIEKTTNTKDKFLPISLNPYSLLQTWRPP